MKLWLNSKLEYNIILRKKFIYSFIIFASFLLQSKFDDWIFDVYFRVT